MPRQKQITMGKVTPQEVYEASIKLNIKKHKPFAIFSHAEIGQTDKDGYVVLYTAPLGGEREVVREEIPRRDTAVLLRDRLNRAFAQGFWSSMWGSK